MSQIPYREKAELLASSAQAFERSLGGSPAARQVALEDLDAAAQGWSSQMDQVQGFGSGSEEPSADAASALDQLTAASFDLQAAGLLLAAGLAADEVERDDEVDGEDDPRELLKSSVGRLEEEIAGSAGPGATLGFGAQPTPAWVADETIHVEQASGTTINAVIDGSLGVLRDAQTRLAEMIPDVIPKAFAAFDNLLDVAPQVGRLVRLGLNALKRALLSLQELVPVSVRAKVRGIAEEWWSDHRDVVQRDVVARLVAADEATAAVAALTVDGASSESTHVIRQALGDLVARFERLTAVFGRVLKGMAAALAIAAITAALVPAVAAWVAPAGAVGYLLVAGSIVLFARDYLDTAPMPGGVDGVQAIVRANVAG